MADRPISLSKARKAKARAAAKRQADANAVRFGRSKPARRAEEAETDRATRKLDGHQSAPKHEP
ncbi:MAG: DUF4169 family protein [Pseudomonadota bacterium]